MDSKAFGYFVNHKTLNPIYYETKKEENCVIDLGLSLRALQPEAHVSSPNDDYGYLMGWDDINPRIFKDNFKVETNGAQRKGKWGYVKVNMDGNIVGRKICILDHKNYSTLALQLEDMFGGQTLSGLNLFQTGSEFTLFYMDTNENWRTVGDIPWKEFVDNVIKRLRIVRSNETLLTFP